MVTQNCLGQKVDPKEIVEIAVRDLVVEVVLIQELLDMTEQMVREVEQQRIITLRQIKIKVVLVGIVECFRTLLTLSMVI